MIYRTGKHSMACTHELSAQNNMHVAHGSLLTLLPGNTNIIRSPYIGGNAVVADDMHSQPTLNEWK